MPKYFYFAAAIAMFFATVFESLNHGVESSYRRMMMVRLIEGSERYGEFSITDMEQIEHHRDRLVELGTLFHFRHKFEHVPVTPATHTAILQEIRREYPDCHLWLLSTDNILDVYDFRANETAWHEFIGRLESRLVFTERSKLEEDKTEKE